MTKYYRKDIPEMPVYINGTPLKFEVLATADAALIAELDKCIQHGRGGVMATDEADYNEASKKKPSETRSESVFKQKQQRPELSAMQLSQNLAADAGVSIGGAFDKMGRDHTPHNQFGLPKGAGPDGRRAMPDPIEVPAADNIVSTKPPTARMTEVLAK